MNKSLYERAKIGFAALVLWAIFGVYDALAWSVIPFAIALYVVADSPRLYGEVGAFGQAIDQACNVIFLGGHPKETVSSHCGRFFEAKFGNPHKHRPATQPDLVIPWKPRFVKWLTDHGEPDHVLHAVEEWTITAGVPL